MKKLEEYKDILHKCSKCGLCQNVCPIFKETQNECNLIRGIIIMLRGVIKGELKLKEVEKYLDNCIACGKCKDICPSDIDIREIALNVKIQYFKSQKIKRYFIRIIQSKFVLGLRTFFPKVLKKCKKDKTKKQDVLVFKGCGKCSKTKLKDIETELKTRGIEYDEISDICCGYSYLKSGNIKRFEENKRELEKQIKDYRVYLTKCKTCEYVLNNYVELKTEKGERKEFKQGL